MKKFLMMAVAAALMCGCEKAIVAEDESVNESEWGGVGSPSKKFTFTVKGDFGNPTFVEGDGRGGASAYETSGNRANDSQGGASAYETSGNRAAGYLSADGQEMTDLWVFDFVGGECVHIVHQEQATAGDAWGKPQMSLAYGSHHVYFVASRGTEPVLDAEAKTLTWGTVRDTFWKDYEVEVVSTSNGNRAVTLDRVVTKLKVTVNDEIPAECAQLVVTPGRWYYGLNYVTGAAVAQQHTERTVTVPAGYVGTSGQLVVSIFGMSDAVEWTTDVTLQAKDGNGGVVGAAVIADAPFKRNRATEYSGVLFGAGGAMDVTLGGDWEPAVVGSW